MGPDVEPETSGGHAAPETAPLTIGVEEEYLLADTTTGALVPRSRDAFAAASNLLGDAVTQELNLCQIEVSTPVCRTLGELGGSLDLLRQQMAVACRPLGLAALATGTHPFSPWQDQAVERANRRYASIEDRYQIVARQQVICGYHVHVGVADVAQRIRVMNLVRPWLPLVLALSANSPFWQDSDSGYASYRTQVWQRWPMAGMPPSLDGPDAYDDLVAGLMRSQHIEDATHLYWYVRPSARFPTLEFRVCDVCLDTEDAVILAGLLRALVWTCSAARPAGAAGEVDPAGGPGVGVGVGDDYHLRAAVWRAARYGLEGLLVDPESGVPGPAAEVIRSALVRLGPGLDAHGDRARVTDGVARILSQGNGAMWQRQTTATVGRRGLASAIAARTAGEDAA